MKGYATEILESETTGLQTREREYLQRIVRGSNRMEKMIQDVLVYSRLNSAKLALEPTDLDKLISETLLTYEEFQPNRAQITVRRPLSQVLAHETSLVQALANILSNSVKFVEPGTFPKIEIWTEIRKLHVRLWIKDNGIGIKPEYQPRIFGMFERAHQDAQFEGTGVGLAIARKVVEKMNGTIGVESDGKNGSAFWIELPSLA
jgi:signal transduction histidine kinase